MTYREKAEAYKNVESRYKAFKDKVKKAFGEKAPCFNCPNRHYKCHANCEPYKKFAEEKRRENKERAKEFSKMIYTGRTR